MKKILTLMISIMIAINVQAQCDPDTIAPTFELPMYLTDGIVYPCLDSVPALWGPPYPDVADIVYGTLEDNCLNPNEPPWYGPSMTSSVLNQTDNSITYTFTASDDGPNYNTQSMTFYFESDCSADPCDNDTTPPIFNPYPPEVITVTSLNDLILPVIEVEDDCSDASLSWVLDNAIGCETEECYVIEWTAIDESGNVSVAYTIIEISDPLGIEEIEIQSMKVFPNPSSGEFTVTGVDSWRIYNISGQIVNSEILEPGMYIVKSGSQSTKLIVR